MNKILANDIEKLSTKIPDLLLGNSILITGATGLIGSLIVKCLSCHNLKSESNKITIYANCRSIEKFNTVFNDYLADKFLIPVIGDIKTINLESYAFENVIHSASITSSKDFITSPIETILTAIDGTNNILNYSSKKSLKNFIYLSSLEVYGSFPSSNEIINVTENKYGFLDHTSVRSSYSEGKKMTECLCMSYFSEKQLPVKIARLSQTFGPGVQYNDNRVFAQFARNIIEKKDLILKTKGETIRNYCYTADAVSALFTIMSKGIPGEIYNVANKDTTISIAEMANLYCSLFPESGSKLIFDLSENPEKLGYNPIVKLALNTDKIEKLGWKAETTFEEMIKNLIGYMKESK